VKPLKIAAGLVVSALLLGILLWTVDLHELGDSLKRARWEWVLLSVGCTLAGLWIRARRWRYLFPPRSDPPGLVPAIMIGYMVNNILPLRAGEVVRVYVVARRWHRGFWTTLATLVVERVLDSLAIVLILGVLVLMIPVPAVFRWTAATLLAIDAAAVAVLALLAVAPGAGRRLIGVLTRRWPALDERLTRVFDRFVRGLDGIRTPAHLPPLIVWSALVWVAPALASWTMLRALDLPLPLVVGWTVLAFVGMGVSIPSAPGYVGVFHYAAVLALEVFGVPRAAALGYAILFHASQFIPVTLVGWIFLLREHLSLGEATHARPAEEAG
jgi:glycosyltransferase 2 family protein